MKAPVLQRLSLRNLLSFGPAGETVELGSLNVLIGPNGSGKSNLLEAVGLLKATPNDLAGTIAQSGGVEDWLWQGEGRQGEPASIEAILEYSRGRMPLRYQLEFTADGHGMARIVNERIENEHAEAGHERPFFYFGYENGIPRISVPGHGGYVEDAPALMRERWPEYGEVRRLELKRDSLDPSLSVLAQRQGEEMYPELTYVSDIFSKIRLYREWWIGRQTSPRMAQRADLRREFLEESAANLALVLNYLKLKKGTKKQILDYLQRFNDKIAGFEFEIVGGNAQLFIEEQGLRKALPATRLSDGTLRYLCLLTILLHPSPPPLLCIEEPELGLHPDIMETLGELLLGAAQRTQLIITTHSDALVDALTTAPEAVLVCERGPDGGTHFQRLSEERLHDWLQEYRLGELWRKGELGGNPW
ncbi:MAG: AAA family ATPase [Thermaerobacter sp.]|jgi:predicted ATPase|nr:AAA family ATPase [Thermaerobacter sp.]